MGEIIQLNQIGRAQAQSGKGTEAPKPEGDWLGKAPAVLKVGNREWGVDQEFMLWKKVKHPMGTVIVPEARERVKEAMKATGGIEKGDHVCLDVPTRELWGLKEEVLAYIGQRLLEFKGTEASAVYGVRGDGTVVAVVPKQKVGGSSVDIDSWEVAISRLFAMGAERRGTIHTHPGNMTTPSGEQGDMEQWAKFPGIHYIVARMGGVGVYFSLGGMTWDLEWVYPDIDVVAHGAKSKSKKQRKREAREQRRIGFGFGWRGIVGQEGEVVDKEVTPKKVVKPEGVVLVGEDGSEEFAHLVEEKQNVIIVTGSAAGPQGWFPGYDDDYEYGGMSWWERHNREGRHYGETSLPDSIPDSEPAKYDMERVKMLALAAHGWGSKKLVAPAKQVFFTGMEKVGRTRKFSLSADGVFGEVEGAYDPAGQREERTVELGWEYDQETKVGWWNEIGMRAGIMEVVEALWEVSHTKEGQASPERGVLVDVSGEVKKMVGIMEGLALRITALLEAAVALELGFTGKEAVKRCEKRLMEWNDNSEMTEGAGKRIHGWIELANMVKSRLAEGWFQQSTWTPDSVRQRE